MLNPFNICFCNKCIVSVYTVLHAASIYNSHCKSLGFFFFQEILDADEEPLISRHGVKMKRDIVQFVPLRQFRKQRDPNNFSLVSTFFFIIKHYFL